MSGVHPQAKRRVDDFISLTVTDRGEVAGTTEVATSPLSCSGRLRYEEIDGLLGSFGGCRSREVKDASESAGLLR